MRFLGKKILLVAVIMAALAPNSGNASDHDDGEADLKGRALSLTDVYAFREDKEVAGGSASHLVFIVNTNPRSIPRQQYYFSTQANYDFHVSRVGTSKDVAAKTTDDIIFRVNFDAQDSASQQKITLSTIVDGVTTTKSADDAAAVMKTTTLAGAASPIVSSVTINGHVIQIFAGLRKDPFFFDVTAFFKFRLAAATSSPANPPLFSLFPGVITPDGDTALDFTTNYNVNTIAFRVPIAFLQTAAVETVFDTWATVSVPQ